MPSVTTILTVILVAVGGFMTFLIMLQEGKGGGLAALSGTKASGIEGVTNPIRRATGWLAGLFFLLAVALAIINRPSENKGFITDKDAEKGAASEVDKNTAVPNGAPAAVGPTRPGEAVHVEVPKAPEPVSATSTAPTTTVPPKAVEPVKPDATKANEPVKVEIPKPTEPVKVETPKAVEPK